jgi:hypothetical protein
VLDRIRIRRCRQEYKTLEGVVNNDNNVVCGCLDHEGHDGFGHLLVVAVLISSTPRLLWHFVMPQLFPPFGRTMRKLPVPRSPTPAVSGRQAKSRSSIVVMLFNGHSILALLNNDIIS